MEKKFKILRIVAFVWKIIAWVILVISVLGGCGCLVMGLAMGDQLARTAREFGVASMTGTALSGAVAGIALGVSGILTFIPIYAFAEIIDVMLALEENTRATAEQLKNIAKS